MSNDNDFFTKAKEFYKAGAYDDCYALVKQIRLDGDGPPTDRVLHLLADVSLQLGRFGEAIEVYSRLLSSKEDDVAYANRAFAYAEQGRVADAVNDYQRAVTCNPANAVAARLGAECLMKLDRYDEAIQLLNRVVAEKVRSAEVFRMLGVLQSKIGQWMPAYKAFYRAVEIDPNDTFSKKALMDIERMANAS